MHQKEKKKRSHGKKRSPLECHQSADGENRETKKKKKTKKMGKKKNQQPQTLKPNQEFVQGSDVCVCAMSADLQVHPCGCRAGTEVQLQREIPAQCCPERRSSAEPAAPPLRPLSR